MSMRTQALILPSSAQFNGAFSLASRLIDTIAAAPYEGLWTPTLLEQSGISRGETARSRRSGLNLFGTNTPDTPLNTYTITIGGSATQNDVVTATFTNPNLQGGLAAPSYTVGATPSLNSVAAGLAAAIAGNAALAAIGVTASATAAVVTVKWPSIVPGQANSGPPEFLNQLANPMTVATTLSGGATETAAVGIGTDGYEFAQIGEIGFTSLPMPIRYVKARLASITGTSVSALYQGVG